jgi:hypothetical protein
MAADDPDETTWSAAIDMDTAGEAIKVAVLPSA